MSRERLTWKNKRVASPPPAIPMEEGGYEHPASYEDPEADKYFVGQNDPSQWAEDPTTGPYENSPHPAVPTEPGGYNHPAGDPKNLRVAATRRAAKCIRIAENLFGKTISVDDIEARALSMMDWPENHIDAALERIAGGFSDSEDYFDGDFGDELDALETRLATRPSGHQASIEEQMFAEMLAEERAGSNRQAEWYAAEDDMDMGDHYAEGMYADDEEESMLDDMLMAMMEYSDDEDDMDEEEAMLAEMNRMAAKKAEDGEDESNDEEEDEEEESNDEDESDEEEKEGGKKAAYSELDVVMDSSEDAMGLSEGNNLDTSSILSQLYSKSAAEDEEGGEEESEGDEGEEEKEGSKKSASSKLRPRAPKPNKGPKVLGNVSKKTASEIQDLESLWDSAPDVSDIF